jgi:hypothetical protein
MSDGDLRLLERAWRESGSEADEAAFLCARVRSGLLARESLERAETLGHAAASLALYALVVVPQRKAGKRGDRGKRKDRRRSGPPSDQDHHGGVFWVIGLEAWGREACVRAAVAPARLALPVIEAPHEAALARRAIEAAEAWIVEPTADQERLAEHEASRVTGGASPAGAAAACACLAAQAAGELVAERGPGVAFLGGDIEAARGCGAGEAALDAASTALRAGFEPEQVRGALRAELAPWLLRYVDPVRARRQS